MLSMTFPAWQPTLEMSVHLCKAIGSPFGSLHVETYNDWWKCRLRHLGDCGYTYRFSTMFQPYCNHLSAMFQSCSNSWFKSTALHNSTALHISMVSINIKKTIKKWATKQTRNKARPQANAGARVQTHIGRLRARLPRTLLPISKEKSYPDHVGLEATVV